MTHGVILTITQRRPFTGRGVRQLRPVHLFLVRRYGFRVPARHGLEGSHPRRARGRSGGLRGCRRRALVGRGRGFLDGFVVRIPGGLGRLRHPRRFAHLRGRPDPVVIEVLGHVLDVDLALSPQRLLGHDMPVQGAPERADTI